MLTVLKKNLHKKSWAIPAGGGECALKGRSGIFCSNARVPLRPPADIKSTVYRRKGVHEHTPHRQARRYGFWLFYETAKRSLLWLVCFIIRLLFCVTKRNDTNKRHSRQK